MKWANACTTCLAGLLLAATAQAQKMEADWPQEDAALIERIFQEWGARVAQLKSVRMEFRGEVFSAKRTIFRPEGNEYSIEDHTNTMRAYWEIDFENSMGRHEVNSQNLFINEEASRAEWIPSNSVITWNGREGRSLRIDYKELKVGGKRLGGADMECMGLFLGRVPVRQPSKQIDAIFGPVLGPGDLRLEARIQGGKVPAVDLAHDEHLEGSGTPAIWEYRVLLVPGCPIIRRMFRREGQVTGEYELEYDPADPLRPVAYRHASYDRKDGSLSTSGRLRVTNFETNVPMAADRFWIEAEPGMTIREGGRISRAIPVRAHWTTYLYGGGAAMLVCGAVLWIIRSWRRRVPA